MTLGNPRHERFAQALAKGQSADAAYVAAGYARNEGNAGRLNRNEQVQARVREILDAGAIRAEISVERVLTELGRIGFADMRKLLKWTGNQPQMNIDEAEMSGEVEIAAANFVRLFDSDELDADTVAAISEISQTKEGALKVKLHDKQAALVAIGRHLGMFKDRVEHTGKDGKPIQYEKVREDADAVTSAIAGLVERARSAGVAKQTEH